MRLDEIIYYLKSSYLFSELDAGSLLSLAQQTQIRTLFPKEITIRQGAISPSVQIVIKGILQVFAIRPDKKIDIIAERGAGKVLGEISILGQLPATASVRAKGRATILEIQPIDFLKCVEKDNKILHKVLRLNFLMVNEGVLNHVQITAESDKQKDKATFFENLNNLSKKTTPQSSLQILIKEILTIALQLVPARECRFTLKWQSSNLVYADLSIKKFKGFIKRDSLIFKPRLKPFKLNEQGWKDLKNNPLLEGQIQFSINNNIKAFFSWTDPRLQQWSLEQREFLNILLSNSKLLFSNWFLLEQIRNNSAFWRFLNNFNAFFLAQFALIVDTFKDVHSIHTQIFTELGPKFEENGISFCIFSTSTKKFLYFTNGFKKYLNMGFDLRPFLKEKKKGILKQVVFPCPYLGYFFSLPIKHNIQYGSLFISTKYPGLDSTKASSLSNQLQRSLNLLNEQIKLKKIATKDGMTEFLRREIFFEFLDEEMHNARQHGYYLSVVILDIDHFKDVNDTWGHQAGDFILKKTALLLKSMLRASDIIGRIGGEEFAYFLRASSSQHSKEVAERICLVIASRTFVYQDVNIKITVSQGLTELRNSDSIETFLKRADTALYKAKNTGRNKVVII